MDAKTNQIIIDVLKPYDPEEIGVFGSYARDEMGPDSDIDILYTLNTIPSLLELVGIKIDLEELLKRRVDLVSRDSLNKRIAHYVRQDLKIIHEKG